jgi:hypothetical protein
MNIDKDTKTKKIIKVAEDETNNDNGKKYTEDDKSKDIKKSGYPNGIYNSSRLDDINVFC